MTYPNLKKIIENPTFMQVIMWLIIFNSVILGLKSYPEVMMSYGFLLDVIDDVLISIFACELILYLIVLGPRKCFTDAWYVFDFVVVSIAVIPAIIYLTSYFLPEMDIPPLGHFSALRAMRVLRILRLISIFPNLRKVIQGLITAIPGIMSIGTILVIMLYVSALMATNLYGEEFPKYFGTLQGSLFSLFQIMSTEGWPDIARTVMEVYPYSWIFFITYILVATFIILNLFIGVIVEAMSQAGEEAEGVILERHMKRINDKLDMIEEQLSDFKAKSSK